MSLFEGILFSVIGNISTGTSQVLQKKALKRLLGKQQRNFLNRLTDIEWLGGIFLSIFGDFMNFIAYSKANPALLIPLGIISIMTALGLSNKFLGESISYRQKKGYIIVLCGVVILLFSSPSSEREIGQSVRSLFDFVLSSRFMLGLLALSLTQALLIYGFYRAKIVNLAFNVCICSIFGGLTITLGRVISLYAGIISVPVDVTMIGPQDYVPSTILQALFVMVTILYIIACTVCQEYFKQKSLDDFPVSLFFPTSFAGLTSVVVSSSVFFWSEFNSANQFRIFFVMFTVAISLIIFGISHVVRVKRKLSDVIRPVPVK
jgi:Magnesium transporter NIPA